MKSLEIKLGFNAKVHINAQRVVEGFERTRCRTDLKRKENGCINFKKAVTVKEGAKFAKNLRALDKGILYLGIDDEVNISLTISEVGVLQSVEFFRERQKRLRKELQLLCMN